MLISARVVESVPAMLGYALPLGFPPLGTLSVWLCSPSTRADTLEITSTPSCANRKIHGVAFGTTPYDKKVPAAYSINQNSLGRRLQMQWPARVSLAFFSTTKRIQMTEGR